jgi:putative transposase
MEDHKMVTNQKEVSEQTDRNLSGVLKIDQDQMRTQLGAMVRQSVEETLNTLLDAEADRLCNAQRYQRSDDRQDQRAGHYGRTLHTQAGEVKLKVPKLRQTTFETAIIERYKRRESSVEEALMEMYLAGVSVRRVEDITQALWGTRVSPSTISELNQKVYAQIETWRNRRLDGVEYPYVYLDGIVLKRSWAGEVKNISVLVAIAVDVEGFREVLGSWEGPKEDREGWDGFLRHLKHRGLKGVQLIVTDKCMGLIESLAVHYPDADWQRCTVHWYRNVLGKVPRQKMREVAAMLKAVHAQENKASAAEKAQAVVVKLRSMKLGEAAKVVEDGYAETLSYYNYPSEHHRQIRTNNPLERIMREIRRRTRVVGNFPDGHSALMLATARLRHIAGTKWGTRRYLNMRHLWEQERIRDKENEKTSAENQKQLA